MRLVGFSTAACRAAMIHAAAATTFFLFARDDLFFFVCCDDHFVSVFAFRKSVTLLKLNTAVGRDLSASLSVSIVDLLDAYRSTLDRVIIAAAVQPPKRHQVRLALSAIGLCCSRSASSVLSSLCDWFVLQSQCESCTQFSLPLVWAVVAVRVVYSALSAIGLGCSRNASSVLCTRLGPASTKRQVVCSYICESTTEGRG